MGAGLWFPERAGLWFPELYQFSMLTIHMMHACRTVRTNHRRAAKRVACHGLCDTNLGSAMLNCSSGSAARIPCLAGAGPSEAAFRVVLNKMTQSVKSSERCAIFNFSLQLGHDLAAPPRADVLTLHYAASRRNFSSSCGASWLDSGTLWGNQEIQFSAFRSDENGVPCKWRVAHVISAQLF